MGQRIKDGKTWGLRPMIGSHGTIIEAQLVKKKDAFDAVPMRDAHISFLYLNEKKGEL